MKDFEVTFVAPGNVVIKEEIECEDSWEAASLALYQWAERKKLPGGFTLNMTVQSVTEKKTCSVGR